VHLFFGLQVLSAPRAAQPPFELLDTRAKLCALDAVTAPDPVGGCFPDELGERHAFALRGPLGVVEKVVREAQRQATHPPTVPTYG
jgi:hypothetical protein